jgi:hypothetical protein
LGCPFGCQKAHRRRQSSQRSTAYYQDEQGKEKKRQQNAKRRKASLPPALPTALPEAPLPWPRPIVEYVRMVTSLIEGRAVGLAEVLEMLGRVLRQHSMVRMRRRDKIVAWLNEHPP